MEATSWLSIALGVAIGVLYGGAAYATLRLALRKGTERFMGIFVGGMLARMVLILVAVGSVLMFAPVEPMPFAGALAACIFIAIILEAALALRTFAAARAGQHAS